MRRSGFCDSVDSRGEDRQLFGEGAGGESWLVRGELTRGDCDNAFGDTGVCKVEANSEGVNESGGVRLESNVDCCCCCCEPRFEIRPCCKAKFKLEADAMSVAECIMTTWSLSAT